MVFPHVLWISRNVSLESLPVPAFAPPPYNRENQMIIQLDSDSQSDRSEDHRKRALPLAITTMDTESYLVVLLADSNLPTGAFVASAGLESYIKHGFSSVTSFVQESLSTYARSALPFVSDAHRVVTSSDDHAFENETQDIQSKVLTELQRLDEMYESMTLNHVARRASKAQGVALLTLYARSFTPPAPTPTQKLYSKLVDRYKLAIRRGDTPGHLPVCWGVMTAALDLSLGNPIALPRSYLYL